jgi:hypothetical protein
MTTKAVSMDFIGHINVSVEGKGSITTVTSVDENEVTFLLGNEAFKVTIKTSVDNDATSIKKGEQVFTKAPHVDGASIENTTKELIEVSTPSAVHPIGLSSKVDGLIQKSDECWVSPTKPESFNEAGEIQMEEINEVEERDGLKEAFEESQSFF